MERIRHEGRHWRNALRRLRRRKDSEFRYSSVVVSTEPLIIRIGYYDYWTLYPLLKAIGDRKAYILHRFTWQYETPERVNRLAWDTRRRLARFPNQRPIFLCNSAKEVAAITARGFEAHHINNNCFVDENLYKPDPSIEKKFDAVYDAKLDGYKRHHLAERIKSLALITYVDGDPFASPYAVEMKRHLSHAVWHNDPFQGNGWIPDESIPALYNQARVGLALSGEEGQMFASIQYLLAGLPVVSTRSLGGRETFFDSVVARIVDANSDAVAMAVAYFVKNPLDPTIVRQRTVDRINDDRRKFIDLIQSIYTRANCDRSYSHEFSERFYNRFMSYYSKSEILELLGIQNPSKTDDVNERYAS